MHVTAKLSLEERVVQAAARALENQKYVGAVDVLSAMGLISPYELNRWRRGEIPHLQGVIQCGSAKLSDALRIFRSWAETHRLKPSEALYTAHARGGNNVTLQFSATADPDTEAVWRT